MSWCSGFEDICRADVPLRDYTWYRLGGPARWFVTPHDADELRTVLRRVRDAGLAWRVLGRGANVLVRDAGFDGVVVHLTGPAWEEIRYDGECVHAAGGVDFPKLVKQTVQRELGGLEGLAGIPGTLGGIIRMNAGGRYGNIGEHVATVRLLNAELVEETLPAAALGFAYRHSDVGARIVLGATLQLHTGDADALTARFQEVWKAKHAEQPAVSVRSAGCIFKNPPGQAAGRLLDEAGLKGTRRGQAEISTRHANFVLAHAGATAQDVLDLISLARERVFGATGIELELEIDVW